MKTFSKFGVFGKPRPKSKKKLEQRRINIENDIKMEIFNYLSKVVTACKIWSQKFQSISMWLGGISILKEKI